MREFLADEMQTNLVYNYSYSYFTYPVKRLKLGLH